MIKDMLQAIGMELNIPPFMEGRPHIPAKGGARREMNSIYANPCRVGD